MASRRSLVSRQNRDTESPQLSRQNRVVGSPQVQRNRQPATLPPYEPPTCPLTESGKRALIAISTNHDYRKYKRHLDTAVQNITNSAADSNDRLHIINERARKMAQRKEVADGDSDKIKGIDETEKRARDLEIKVVKLTAESEKALRELIDYKEELGWQDDILKKVGEEAAAASTNAASGATRMGRRSNDDIEDDDGSFQDDGEDKELEMVGAQASAAIMSPIELLKKVKDEYKAEYTSKTMHARYAEHNDYIGFKRLIHDALNPGDNAPPVPHASTWFPEENNGRSSNPAAARRRRMASRTDNTENADDDDDDDDIQMTGVVSSLKCPLTLRTFQEPYSNRVCKHTFEKSAILQFHRENAVAFVDPSQGPRRRGVPQGPKQLKCPERGCEAMLEFEDFYDDQTVLRQVKRQAAQEAAELDEDEDEDEAPQGTQSTRPQSLGSDADDFADIDRRLTVKNERISQARGQATVHSDDSEDDDL